MRGTPPHGRVPLVALVSHQTPRGQCPPGPVLTSTYPGERRKATSDLHQVPPSLHGWTPRIDRGVQWPHRERFTKVVKSRAASKQGRALGAATLSTLRDIVAHPCPRGKLILVG